MTKFLHSKRVVFSVCSKSLKFYGMKLQFDRASTTSLYTSLQLQIPCICSPLIRSLVKHLQWSLFVLSCIVIFSGKLHHGCLDVSLDLHETQKQQDEIFDLCRVLISLSNTWNKNAQNSSTRQIRLTRMTNSRVVAYKSWMASCSTPVPGFQLKQQIN